MNVLPTWTPSCPAPSYSQKPYGDEQSLGYSPRTRAIHILPDGRFFKKSRGASVLLYNQTEGCQLPTFGPHAPLVAGEVTIPSSRDRIISVTLKIKGDMHVLIMGGAKCIHTLDLSYPLWTRKDVSDSCPESLSFATVIPNTYTENDETYLLPPTFHAPVESMLQAYVKTQYSLTLEIVRTVHSKLEFLRRKTSLSVPFKYEIRDRPRHSYICAPPTSILKSVPEEWDTVSTTIGTKPETDLSPIECQLVLPSTRTFGLSDPIPFHLELFGRPESLRTFFGTDATTSSKGSTMVKSPLRLSLIRLVSVTLGELRGSRSVVLGEAELKALPPSLYHTAQEASDQREVSLEWEGELRAKDTEVGGFHSGAVSVRDFIMLSFTPWSYETSPLVRDQHFYPIRLVTDSLGPTTLE